VSRQVLRRGHSAFLAALRSSQSRAAASPLSERGRASVLLCLAILLAGLVVGGCGAGQSTGPSVGGQSATSASTTAAAATGARKLQILVLGDSYSAGNGAGDYSGPTGCRRSPNNYAGNFQTMLEVKYGVRAFVTNDACSGEKASQFFTPLSGQPPESAAPNSSYKLILLTFGGDDVSFSNIVQYCLIAKAQYGPKCLQYLDAAVADLQGGVSNSTVAYVLNSDLQYIHSHAPNARIVLLGYPYLESDQTYTLIDRGEGSNSVAGDACGERQGTTNLVTVGQCLHEIGNLGEQVQSGLVAKLDSQDHTNAFVFVSTQKLFEGDLKQPTGFSGPNHELTATGVNPNRWFIQPFVDAESGLQGDIQVGGGLVGLPTGVDVFYHPNPTGWEEEAKLLMATPAVVNGLASGQATTSTTSAAPTTTTTTTSPSTTTTSTTQQTAGAGSFSGVATDQQGDRVSVTVGVGSPTPMSSSSSSAVSACDADVEQEQSSPQRSIAVPFTVSMTVQSSLATSVSVGLDGFGIVTSGGSVDANGEQTLGGTPLWAGAYSSGPTCQTWNDLGAGVVDWSASAATPNSTQSWSAWLIIPNAITPNDPSGLDVAQNLVLQPAVSISGGELFNLQPSGSSSSVVSCYSQSDLIPGNAPFLALDPSAAISNGCTSKS
jgi:hypothetical protein